MSFEAAYWKKIIETISFETDRAYRQQKRSVTFICQPKI